jgi:CubicO group peptidase (beta-lactamase class C family)
MMLWEEGRFQLDEPVSKVSQSSRAGVLRKFDAADTAPSTRSPHDARSRSGNC